MKKILSLAAGWGGTTALSEEVGYRCVGAIDTDENARKYHDLNHPHAECANMDLMTVRPEEILERFGEVDVISNTCPCTNIARINKNSTPFCDLNAMLLRSVKFLKVMKTPSMLIENVPSLVHKGEMEILYELLKKEYNKLKDYVWIDDHPKNPLNNSGKLLTSLDFNTPQDRYRYVAYIIHKDALKKELILPPKTTQDYKSLRIGNNAPHIRVIKTGYTDEFKRHDKLTPRTYKDYCFTATATVNLFDQNDEPLDIPTLLKFCGYPESWIYSLDPKDHAAMWHLIGNSVMPPFGRELFRHLNYLTS